MNNENIDNAINVLRHYQRKVENDIYLSECIGYSIDFLQEELISNNYNKYENEYNTASTSQ